MTFRMTIRHHCCTAAFIHMAIPSITRRQLGLRAASALVACAAGSQWSAQAQLGPRTNAPLRIAVGGKGDLYYLPLTVAERLGYFRDEGLRVEIAAVRTRAHYADVWIADLHARWAEHRIRDSPPPYAPPSQGGPASGS